MEGARDTGSGVGAANSLRNRWYIRVRRKRVKIAHTYIPNTYIQMQFFSVEIIYAYLGRRFVPLSAFSASIEEEAPYTSTSQTSRCGQGYDLQLFASAWIQCFIHSEEPGTYI